MAVQLNHTIVPSRDKKVSAQFLTDILGLDPPSVFGHFVAVQVANGVTLDYDHRGRGFYFSDPDGHNMEVLTRPYTD